MTSRRSQTRANDWSHDPRSLARFQLSPLLRTSLADPDQTRPRPDSLHTVGDSFSSPYYRCTTPTARTIPHSSSHLINSEKTNRTPRASAVHSSTHQTYTIRFLPKIAFSRVRSILSVSSTFRATCPRQSGSRVP